MSQRLLPQRSTVRAGNGEKKTKKDLEKTKMMINEKNGERQNLGYAMTHVAFVATVYMLNPSWMKDEISGVMHGVRTCEIGLL